ncbi:uncharacterized protein PHACADRAFT_118176 [Phanerochaete carnosa HHB-10118-sp]|uniref:DUF6589 domain-containing protein n=1 Tax=Phanerochaete carnosa (strain HHB-10118-sp) TaxID=650164 RepID=K5VY11_PHACS|nr:uncharacterized protein PHACADRAFT_118176 [Phanerochaete carnosa HHB-10118-sp]EKM56458.1 hypothetical protein PHACADRAFT_118176 [Phanerochaete carnosa HHB-10118-sp]
MQSQAMNTALFLYHLCWNTPKIITDVRCKYERISVTHSKELKGVLQNLYCPPGGHGRGVCSRGAVKAMTEVTQEIVTRQVNYEMRALHLIMEAKPVDFREELLLQITLDNIISCVRAVAPTWWSICSNAAFTPKQAARNTKKSSPDTVLHRCKMQQLMCAYLKSCGLKARAFDTLHALYFCMSQKTIYTAVDTIAEMTQEWMKADVKDYPIRSLHDNINIRFQVYEQRTDNKSHFDSSMAATVYPVKDPDAVPLNAAAYHEKRASGSQNSITPLDIFELDSQASPRIHTCAVYQIIRFLIDSAPFDLSTYEHKESELFKPPPPVHQLPTGPEHALCQYMLGTIHQEEASYEGNKRCMHEWLWQLGLDTVENMKHISQEQLIVWMGDQLTSSRCRGLKNFRSQDLNSAQRFEFLIKLVGWFHINLGFSFHHQYYGKPGMMGLKHAIDLLECRNLATPSVQGTFHHNLNELLHHVAKAHFQDAWCTIANIDSLDELHSCTPQELSKLASKLWEKLASTHALNKLREKTDKAANDYFQQAVMFNRDILDYLELDDAIKTGDVGRVRNLLPRLLFRFLGGGHTDYVIEILELIQALECKWPEDLKVWVLKYCWLGNTTGQPGCFSPFDLIQEHNIWDIKHIFAVFGPYATWEYIKKILAAIPTMRKVKDHVNADINHFRRGKMHMKPSKEIDVTKLQQAYAASKIHVFDPMRPRLDIECPLTTCNKGPIRCYCVRQSIDGPRDGLWQDRPSRTGPTMSHLL